VGRERKKPGVKSNAPKTPCVPRVHSSGGAADLRSKGAEQMNPARGATGKTVSEDAALDNSTETKAVVRLLTVAALFVDPTGPYPSIFAVDPWDKKRDALNYHGRSPVVAHPPCHLWVNFAALNFKRYGGEHNRPGNDGGRFKFALGTVRRVDGVLEHPAGSNAWKTYGIGRPSGSGWRRVHDTEWVCEVWQSAYGHAARKRTWLLYVSRERFPPYELLWDRNPGSAQIGWFDRVKPTLGKKEASRTPENLARVLVCLARRAAVGR
jgi:hypothetical protein